MGIGEGIDFPPTVPDFGDVLSAAAGDPGSVQKKDSGIHIRIQQRNGRKFITTVSGLSKDIDFKKLLTEIKRRFCCNGSVQDDKEFGTVIQLQGDQRDNLLRFLTEAHVAEADDIRV